MLDVEYLYLGGPYDGEWRRPFNGATPGEVVPERYAGEADGEFGRYIPTKIGHMAGFGEGQFRITFTVMLDEPWHDLLNNQRGLEGDKYRYAQRLQRAIVHRGIREHLQRTWRPGSNMLEFGPAWEVFERRPADVAPRLIRDNPQA